jgi:hypothetical protein
MKQMYYFALPLPVGSKIGLASSRCHNRHDLVVQIQYGEQRVVCWRPCTWR